MLLIRAVWFGIRFAVSVAVWFLMAALQAVAIVLSVVCLAVALCLLVLPALLGIPFAIDARNVVADGLWGRYVPGRRGEIKRKELIERFETDRALRAAEAKAERKDERKRIRSGKTPQMGERFNEHWLSDTAAYN